MASSRSSIPETINPLRKRGSEYINDHIAGVMIFPALIVIFAIFIIPLLILFWQSVHVSFGPTSRFAPLVNFQRFLGKEDFWRYLRTTLIYSIGSLGLTISVGLVLALGINKVENKAVRGTYTVLILMGWAIPGVVASMTWKWIFTGSEFGLLNMVLMDLNIINSSVGWLGFDLFALGAVIFVDAWVRIPFAMLVFLAGLQSIPTSMYEAGRIDGGTTYTLFRHVTIPYLRPYFALVALISWMFSFRAFAFVFSMTGGGPGTATQVLAIDIYQWGVRLGDYGYASALSIFLVVMTFVFATFYVGVVMERAEE